MREIQPVVPCFLQLPYHLASNSVALSLSLARFLWQISFEQCHMLEGLFSDNLSDNLSDKHLLHSVSWPSHRAISIILERNERT